MLTGGRGLCCVAVVACPKQGVGLLVTVLQGVCIYLSVTIKNAFGLLQQQLKAGCGAVAVVSQVQKVLAIRFTACLRQSPVLNQIIDAEIQQPGCRVGRLLCVC